jgi:hypothetical protein
METWPCWVTTTNNATSSDAWIDWSLVTSSAVYGDTWSTWCTDTTSSATDNVWIAWCDHELEICGQLGTVVIQSPYIVRPTTVPEPTEEQRAEWARQDRERKRRQEEEQRQIAEANEKAETLLKDVLNEEDYQFLLEMNHLLVETEEHRYKISRRGTVREVDEEGKEIASFCIHERGFRLPDADAVLMHKLMLECDEEEWLRIANKTVYDYARDRV